MTERSDISHDNLLKELEMSSLPDYKIYLQMFPYNFGELQETITPVIQREDMIRQTIQWQHVRTTSATQTA